MTIPRKEIIIEGVEGSYHCMSRCVRRAFLCGYDKLTGNDYSHRKNWIESRLRHLAAIYAIEVIAKAIMSNHLHTVLRNSPDITAKWSAEEVARRWLKLYPQGKTEQQKERARARLAKNKKKIKKFRKRLQNISWFMKSLNEYIAKRANKEDGCKGSFWDGRFSSKALADEPGLLACMVYVDLNPIRAGIAKTPEESEFTSIKDRIVSLEAAKRLESIANNPLVNQDKKKAIILEQQKRRDSAAWLCPIAADDKTRPGVLSITEEQYIKLVDYTGRELKAGKRGSIPKDLAPIFSRLEIDLENWTNTVSGFESLFCRAAGKIENLVSMAEKTGKRWLKGYSAARMAFVS